MLHGVGKADSSVRHRVLLRPTLAVEAAVAETTLIRMNMWMTAATG